jgi:predicted nucleic acid-binding Zn ribbon protein|tara:strand:- start:51468 stop:51752 length:285 start_codon:yes stop_codon:yes gene_type:complete
LKEEKSIKDLISTVFKSYDQGYKYEETSVINSWEQIVGTVIAKKTSKIFINKKVLYLTMTSPALKNELRYHKLVLIDKINDFAKQKIINDINFY